MYTSFGIKFYFLIMGFEFRMVVLDKIKQKFYLMTFECTITVAIAKARVATGKTTVDRAKTRVEIATPVLDSCPGFALSSPDKESGASGPSLTCA